MTNVIGEATRELDEYKNNVDEERTHLNYNLIEGSETRADILAKINTRVKDVMGDKIKPQTRKNMKPLGTWVVTLPQELNGLSDDEKRDFFETALEFIGDRYGKENLVYAAVHNDENQPHMHVGVVPVCTSRKTGKETVSSASMFTRKDLKTFHDDLEKVMTEKYGKKNLMKNGRTKGNYTLDELKERTQTEERLANKQAELNKQGAEIAQVQTELMDTVWPSLKRFKEEKPKVEEQKAKNEADAKKLVGQLGKLQDYHQRLTTMKNDLDERSERLDEKEASLDEREDKLAEREAEASERLREASERLEEAKAVESRVKAMLDEIKERASDIVDKVRDTVSKWTGRVRRKNSETLTAYYNERTETLVDDVETTLTQEDLQDVAQGVEEDVMLYDSDLQGMFDNDLTL